MMHRYVRIMFLVICILYSCSSNLDKYEQCFKENHKVFEDASAYINGELEKDKYKINKNVIVFVQKQQYSPLNNFVYDSYLSTVMKKLGVSEIICRSTDTVKCGTFSDISFKFISNQQIPNKVSYIIYSRCDENVTYKKKYLYQKKLKKNWVLFIDET